MTRGRELLKRSKRYLAVQSVSTRGGHVDASEHRLNYQNWYRYSDAAIRQYALRANQISDRATLTKGVSSRGRGGSSQKT